MGNATYFIAVDLDRKNKPRRIHLFERMGYHDLWDIVVPDEAENDLKYRLKHGPAYNVFEYTPEKGLVETPLRKPKSVHSDSRIHELNNFERSAYELKEFQALTQWLQDCLDAGIEGPISYIAEDLFKDLSDFFRSDYSKYDAIVLEYEM